MKPNIFFKTPKCAGTSILKALEDCGVYYPNFPTHEIQDNGFCVVRYYVGGDDLSENAFGGRECVMKKEWEGDFEANAYLWTVVRNPYERIVSCWFDSRRRGYFSERHSFRDFVTFVCAVKNVQTPKGAMEISRMSSLLCDCPEPGVAVLYGGKGGCECYFGILSHAMPWGHSWLMTGDTTLASSSLPKVFADTYPRNFSRIIRFENLHEDFDRLCKDLEITASLPHTNRRVQESDHYTAYYEGTPDLIPLVENIYQYEFAAFGYRFGD